MKSIGMVAMFYGLEITGERLSLIVDYWGSTNIAPSEIALAYRRFTTESKIQKFPAPVDIMNILRPKTDPHDLGVLIASKIVQAVSRFGNSQPKEALEFIGEAGWNCVRRFGGWNFLCQELGVSIDLTTFQAQAREILKSESKVSAVDPGNHLLSDGRGDAMSHPAGLVSAGQIPILKALDNSK